MLNVELWNCGNMKLWKYENVASVANANVANFQLDIVTGNWQHFHIGNIQRLPIIELV